MDRRDYLKSLGLGAPALALPFAKAVRGEPGPPEELPNIVIIMADDMGLGDPGCYNPGSLIPTPHMDRIAAEGTKFTDAHSAAALCSPTRYSFLTGRYPWRTRRTRQPGRPVCDICRPDWRASSGQCRRRQLELPPGAPRKVQRQAPS